MPELGTRGDGDAMIADGTIQPATTGLLLERKCVSRKLPLAMGRNRGFAGTYESSDFRLSPILNSVKIRAMNDILMHLNGAGLTLGFEPPNA